MLNPSVVNGLKKIVGSENLSTSPEELVAYSYDATRTESLPWAVARPADAGEVSALLTLANRERFPVVPRGAGSGMSGGSVPVRGGVVLSLERMNRILAVDEQNRTAEVEPGVVTGDLQREAEKRGLFYPPDPASSRFCTIGGNVAECAGGLRAVKYGVTRDYVLGLEAVLPTGEIIKTGARTMKSVAGYDLTRLIVGSEGTLAVVTRVMIRLLPLPESVRTIAGFFDDVGAAAAAAQGVAAARVVPRALEIVDRQAIRAVEGLLREDFSGGAGALLLAEVDGTAAAVSAEGETVANVMRRAGALRVETAERTEDRERLWKARRALSAALFSIKPRKLNEDIVVPPARVADILREIGRIAERRGLLIVNFGHAGDGNIHTNIMIEDRDLPEAEAAVRDILDVALGMGGSISGEHGIGLTKAKYLPIEAGAGALKAMKRIKDALDPNGVLNPGKIFV